jgi:RNA polymerase sigma-70 factor, ECF subfamily
MQTASEFETFPSCQAELPHKAGANALTEDTNPRTVAHELTYCVTMADAPSDELVERAKAGDRGALEELLAGARSRAMAAALKILHNRDDAEDAVQDAFLKVWRCLPSFEGRSSFTTWIHRIVTNASLDLLRRCASRGEVIERCDRDEPAERADRAAVSLDLTSQHTPESELGSLELQLMVRAAIAALPPTHREAVELRELEDYSYLEIADATHCPVGTVMSRLHHARHKLADDLRAPLGEALELFAA